MTITEEHEGSTERDRYCAECGYQLSGTRYCPGCGHRVGAPSDSLDARRQSSTTLRASNTRSPARAPPLLRRVRAARRASRRRGRATCGSALPAFSALS